MSIRRRFPTKADVPWKSIACKVMTRMSAHVDDRSPLVGWENPEIDCWDLMPEGASKPRTTYQWFSYQVRRNNKILQS